MREGGDAGEGGRGEEVREGGEIGDNMDFEIPNYFDFYIPCHLLSYS